MATILDDIVAAKRGELKRQRSLASLEELERRIADQPRPLNLSGALLGERVRLIAEVKKASPSKGLLLADFDPAALARTYADNGSAAISVLTDPRFQGTLEHMEEVKQTVLPTGTPVLRKDFVFDPYQVYEARAHGADAILLIVAILNPQEIRELMALARRFWMQCLVEVHNRDELQVALDVGAEIVGINNRDLRTFSTDLSVTEEIAALVPRGRVVVSESGISTREHMLKLKGLGVHAALVGEALVTSGDVGAKVRELSG